MKDKRAIYECEGCKKCFEHKDEGLRIFGICPLGPDTYCKKVTLREFHKDNVRVPTEK